MTRITFESHYVVAAGEECVSLSAYIFSVPKACCLRKKLMSPSEPQSVVRISSLDTLLHSSFAFLDSYRAFLLIA